MTDIDQKPDLYRLKKIPYQGKRISYVMQNINGPCPLIAIANILILSNQMSIHEDYGTITYAHLVEIIKDYLYSPKFQNKSKTDISQIIAQLPSLQFGLDVNVRFQKYKKISNFTSKNSQINIKNYL